MGPSTFREPRLQPKRAVGRLRRMLLHVFAWINLASGSTAWSLDFHPIYADGMVVQRDRPVVVRGTAEPGAEVVLELISRPAANNPTATARTTASPDGQWQMELPGRTPEDAPLSLVAASGPAEKTVKDIRVGDVWLCAGQSNMNFLMRPNLPWSEGVLDWEEEVRSADDQELRFFTVVPEASHTAQEVAHGLWRPASPEFAGYLSAVPFYFGKGIRQTAGVPIGIIVSALGGTSIREWSAPEALRGCPDAENALARHVTLREKHADQVREYYGKQAPAYRQSAVSRMAEPAYAAAYNEPYKGWRHQPSGLFNAMIRPLDWFPIKGILWYQGESDTTRSELYRERLERMIAGQRARRNEPQLPFIVVQLANHDPVARGKDAAKYGDTWALLREAQEEATGLPFTALVVTADVGHATNIHPRNKKTVGTRAAQAAASLVYETSGMAFGPTLTSWEASGREVHLQFANTNGGLVIDRDRSSGDGPDFELAGSDGQFHPASADVRGSQVILSAPEVAEPVSVRYCFHNNPRLVLFDKNGLPARPFRRPAAGEKASR